MPDRTRTILAVAAVAAVGLLLAVMKTHGTTARIEVAAVLSLTGDTATFGVGSLEGIKFAIEEANASDHAPRLELKVYDDKSSAEGARDCAAQVAASPAAVVIGPSSSSTSLSAGPIFAKAGLASIATTATSDAITENATTFRVLFQNSDQGEMLATYLYRVLGQRAAAVLVVDGSYGRTLEKGFRAAAATLGLDATYHAITANEEVEDRATAIAAEIGSRAVVLAMVDREGAVVLPILRRLGVKGPFLGGDPFAGESFAERFAGLPEEKDHPGAICEGLYGLTPMLIDSANAALLKFAERFHARFGHDPGWLAVAGYDAARTAIEAVRAADAKDGGAPSMRAATLKHLLAPAGSAPVAAGLLGPLAFDAARGRQVAVRVGRFTKGRFESAPLQIVAVRNPDPVELEAGAVFPLSGGNFARLQQVIYSGLYLNDLVWMDQTHFTFAADFYVWLRFAASSGVEAADPSDIKFPDLVHGHFDRERPVERREMPDGTSYLLWRVQGEFQNQFDLHRYPFDRQTLTLRFFNSRAAADRIVYALDRGATQDPGEAAAGTPSGASKEAFRRLSQWTFLSTHQQRESFVAKSSLGDPRRMGRLNYRELSGYAASIDLQRRSLATLTKSLLPLFLMTCIMYAALHFPAVLVQPKIGVAMTGVLTGVVLLNLVNGQLGAIGYTVAVEWAFYVYFALGLLLIVSALIVEHLRELGRTAAARRADLWSRALFLSAVAGLFVAAYAYQ